MYYFSRSPRKDSGRGAGLLKCRGQGAARPPSCLSRPISRAGNSPRAFCRGPPPRLPPSRPPLPLPEASGSQLTSAISHLLTRQRLPQEVEEAWLSARHCGASKGARVRRGMNKAGPAGAQGRGGGGWWVHLDVQENSAWNEAAATVEGGQGSQMGAPVMKRDNQTAFKPGL